MSEDAYQDECRQAQLADIDAEERQEARDAEDLDGPVHTDDDCLGEPEPGIYEMLLRAFVERVRADVRTREAARLSAWREP